MAILLEAAVIAWPLALTIACAVAVEHRRERRRRGALNRALHELRRPLQLLALWPAEDLGARRAWRGAARSHLDAALAALGELDAAVNGRRWISPRRALRADELAAAALERWSAPAALLGRELDLRWRAGPATVVGDPVALSRALDNLLANALEHGARRVLLEGRAERGRLRVAVVSTIRRGGPVGELAGPLGPRPRGDGSSRGHGHSVVAEIAADHRGRFAFSAGAQEARAVLELPLAYDPGRARRSRSPSAA